MQVRIVSTFLTIAMSAMTSAALAAATVGKIDSSATVGVARSRRVNRAGDTRH